MASTKPIQRITLFKIPNAEDQDKLLEIYRHMPEKAVKVGRHPPFASSSSALRRFQNC